MTDAVIPERVLRDFPVDRAVPTETPEGPVVSGVVAVGQTKTWGFVEAHEEAEAKRLIDDDFRTINGKPFDYRPGGYFIAAKIYVRPDELSTVSRPDGSKVTLWRPPSSTANDKYQSCSALVLAVGPQAYKGRNPDGSEKFPEGPWCRVGDWICIKRYESFLVNFRGVPIAIFPDDQVLGVIADPTDITPIHQNDRH